MRRVTVRVRHGEAGKVIVLATQAGAQPVFVHQMHAHGGNASGSVYDVIDVDAATPVARRFVEALMAAPFFDPRTDVVSVVHPQA